MILEKLQIFQRLLKKLNFLWKFQIFLKFSSYFLGILNSNINDSKFLKFFLNVSPTNLNYKNVIQNNLINKYEKQEKKKESIRKKEFYVFLLNATLCQLYPEIPNLVGT